LFLTDSRLQLIACSASGPGPGQVLIARGDDGGDRQLADLRSAGNECEALEFFLRNFNGRR
jgi:hypothetical protein